MPKSGIKNALFGFFGATNVKEYCCIWNQYPQICLFAKFCEETKMLTFRPKMLYFGIFKLELSKTIVIFKISILKFIYLQNFAKKIMPKFGTKSALLGYSWARIIKNYCHSWNQYLQICLFANFWEKKKYLSLGPKVPHLEIFWLDF